MNREELPRIRLKVATNAGINILCTAVRTWKVVEWLPHIEQAYREVKEDQEGDEDSRRRFIKAIRIKKGNFYIANSEFIGDIFEDNDQVQCEIAFPQSNDKKKGKKEKKNEKKISKYGSQDEIKEIQQIQLNNQVEELNEEHNQHKEAPKKKLKTDHPQHQKAQRQSQKKQPKNKSNQKQVIPHHDQRQQKHTQTKPKSQTKQNLMKSIDFSKLKSILNSKVDSKPSISKEDQVKIEAPYSDSQSSEQQN